MKKFLKAVNISLLLVAIFSCAEKPKPKLAENSTTKKPGEEVTITPYEPSETLYIHMNKPEIKAQIELKP